MHMLALAKYMAIVISFYLILPVTLVHMRICYSNGRESYISLLNIFAGAGTSMYHNDT